MSKITVKHYLNKDLNPEIKDNKIKYPIYVHVIVLKKNLKFKSNNNYFSYLSESDIENEMIMNILNDEKKIIDVIITDLLEKGKEDLITSKNLSTYTQNLNDLIEVKFCNLIREERNGKFVPNVILNGNYSDINEIIYFYNNESPISDISENVHYCLNAIQSIYEDINKENFYVYDLFGGLKHDKILSALNYSSNFDDMETNKMLMLLQHLTE